jgi:hypothetical protein
MKNFPGQNAVNAALADTNRATALNLFANGTTIRNNPPRSLVSKAASPAMRRPS